MLWIGAAVTSFRSRARPVSGVSLGCGLFSCSRRSTDGGTSALIRAYAHTTILLIRGSICGRWWSGGDVIGGVGGWGSTYPRG